MCSIRKQNSNWTHGTCVKCGEAFLFWKDATGKRCNECEKEGIHYPEPTSSIEYKMLFDKYQDLKAKHERVLQMLEIAEKALEKISYWGVDPTSTAIAAVSEKALDQIKGLKK